MSDTASTINSVFCSFVDSCLPGGRSMASAVFKRRHLPANSKSALSTRFRHSIVGFYVILISGFATMPAMAAPDLSAGHASGKPGQSVEIPVQIVTDGSVVALQLDLSFDPLLLSATGISAGPALTDHALNWEEVALGHLRLVFTTASASALADGELASLTMLIDDDARPGIIPLVLDSIIQSDARALLVAPSSQTNGSRHKGLCNPGSNSI